MLASGIVRRMDDLGRVVVPKEIRRRLHIEEGCPLEIFIDEADHSIIFRKVDEETEFEKLKTAIRDFKLNADPGEYHFKYELLEQFEKILEKYKVKE